MGKKKQKCPVAICTAVISANWLMCGQCWKMVPKPLKDELQWASDQYDATEDGSPERSEASVWWWKMYEQMIEGINQTEERHVDTQRRD